MTFREKSAQLHDYLGNSLLGQRCGDRRYKSKEIHANLGNSSSTEKSMVCLNFSSWEVSSLPGNKLLFPSTLVKGNDWDASTYRGRVLYSLGNIEKNGAGGSEHELVLPPGLSEPSAGSSLLRQ